ncbi:hypothetical protein [Tetragenococcus muriaticus]|uniref:Uncharacterized protein n=1 Tax=Tetragenococcus muriaticus 3MR10-3 TaxID=1302648 RepID=A0A091C2H9_9ENTE|nr:hypothetical protein [Tetragenococcus muriaticus]KFN92051.1 hypothetical protein TMU3MR103_0694 [Tetragenococcus muriaticus 3MR10-3]
MPNTERLQVIADLAETDINTFLYGSFEDYIIGLVVYEDKLLTKGSEEKNLYEFIVYHPFSPSLSSMAMENEKLIKFFANLTLENKALVANQTYEKCLRENLGHFDSIEICKTFIASISAFLFNDIRGYTLQIQMEVERIEQEWTDFLQEVSNDNNALPNMEGIQEIFEALTNFYNGLEKINEQYSNLNTEPRK